MKVIKGLFNVSSTDHDSFMAMVKDNINLLQEDEQEVEIQYKVNTFDNGQVLYSAMIIGRFEV